MSTPLANQLETALADLREQQRRIGEFGAAMAEKRTSVTSKNRMVSATVDSSGRLVELTFKGNRFRSLPPAELAALVVETVTRAQDTASREAAEAAAELVPDTFDLPGLTAGRLDLDGLFDAAVRLAEQPVFPGEQS